MKVKAMASFARGDVVVSPVAGVVGESGGSEVVGGSGGPRAQGVPRASGAFGSLEQSGKDQSEGCLGVAGVFVDTERGSNAGRDSVGMGGPMGSGSSVARAKMGHQDICDKVLLALGSVGGTFEGMCKVRDSGVDASRVQGRRISSLWGLGRWSDRGPVHLWFDVFSYEGLCLEC